MYGIIYCATNKINNKKYIGQTIRSLSRRKTIHIYESKHGSKYYFHQAIKKYGKDNFIWDILLECSSKEELNEKEEFFIKKYNTMNNGYNLTRGGQNGGTRKGKHNSKEQKQKLSKLYKGSGNPFYGKKHSKKTLKIISEFSKRLNERCRKIKCLETGRTFNKIMDAERELKIGHQSISFCCSGRYQTAGGYHWKYVEE